MSLSRARAVSGRLAEHVVARVDERLLLMVVGVIVGVCAGLAAVGLNRSIAFVEHFLHAARERPWAFAIPGLGAAASAILLRWVVRERSGHGVPVVENLPGRQPLRLDSLLRYDRLGILPLRRRTVDTNGTPISRYGFVARMMHNGGRLKNVRPRRTWRNCFFRCSNMRNEYW